MKPNETSFADQIKAAMTDDEAQAAMADDEISDPRRKTAPPPPRRQRGEPGPVESDRDEASDADEDSDQDDADSEPPPAFAPPTAPSQWQQMGTLAASAAAERRRNARLKKEGKTPMAGAAPAPRKEPPRDEVPRAEIAAMEAQYPEVRLDICRVGKAASGAAQRAGVKGIPSMPIRALFDLQGPMMLFCGGGTFEYFALDPVTRQPILPRWQETYEGRPVQPRQGYRLLWDNDRGKLVIGPDPDMMGPMEADAPPGAPPPLPHFGNLAAAMNPHIYASPLGSVYAQQPQVQMGPQIPMTAFDRMGNLLPPPSDLVPGWMRSMTTPQMQWAHVLDEARKGNAEAAKATAVQQTQAVAMDWVQHNLREQGHMQADRARLEERTQRMADGFQAQIKQLESSFETKLNAERDARVKAERELEVQRAESKYAGLEAKLDALARAPAPVPPPDPFAQIVPLATAFVPLLVESRRSEVEREKIDREAQSKLMTTVLGKPAPNPIADLMPLLAAFGPLFVEYMKNNSPKMQAEVLNLEHDQRMMMLKMMADMVQANMPEEPPAWAPLVQMGVQWLGQTLAQRQAAAAGQLPQQQQRALNAQNPQVQQQQVQQQPVQQTHVSAPPGPFDAVLAHFAQQDQEAAAMTAEVWRQLPPQAGFQSHEWLTIIFNVHAKLDVDQMAEMFAAHLYHCQKFNILPPAFKDVFEEGKTEGALRTVLQVLPIYMKDNAYCEAVILKATQMIDEIEEEEGEDNDEREEPAYDADAIVTPAPAAADA